MKRRHLLFSLNLLVFSSTFLCAQIALATPYSTFDTTKYSSPQNLTYGGTKYLTGSDKGVLTIDQSAKTINYQDRVQNSAGTGGYDIHLNWNIVPLSDLISLGYNSAPRCANGNCNGPYYMANGINPQTDWLFLLQDTSKTNTFTEWGSLGTSTLSIGTKWGQLGNGAGGVHVLPEGFAMGVWFNGGGDLNVNTSMPEPSSVLLLGTGIAALAGWRRYRQQ